MLDKSTNRNVRVTDILRKRLVRQMRKAHEGKTTEIKARVFGVNTMKQSADYFNSESYKEFAEECKICQHSLSIQISTKGAEAIVCNVHATLLDPDFYKVH